MKIENHVVSLELAKQLKEAGYPQDETYFCWDLETATIWQFVERTENYIAAPLASELGEELGDNEMEETGSGWVCRQYFADLPGMVREKEGTTEADARAKMWLYLKKEGLLPPPQSGEKGKNANI